MNYISLFFEGSVLGLTTGISCAVFCIPVLIGISLWDEKSKPVKNLLLFLGGRFISYLLFALILSIIGENIKNIKVDFIINPLIGALLIFWGFKFLFGKEKDKTNCSIKRFSNLTPFLMGIITGISPCPPFIAGGLKILSLGSPLSGVIYFIGFYITTSFFLLPSLLTVFIKYKKEIKIIAGFISIIFGSIYLISGLFSVII